MKKIMLALTIILLGCKSNVTEQETKGVLSIEVRASNNNEICFESLFDSIEFIPIDDRSVIGSVDECIVINDTCYVIADNHYTKRIYLIGSDGAILNQYKYCGTDPNQGLYLRDITFDNKSQSIYVLLNSPDKVLIFDIGLGLQRNVVLDNKFERLHAGANSNVLFYEHEKLKLWNARNILSKPRVQRSLDMEYFPFSQTPIFINTGLNLYFNIPHDSLVYEVKNDTLFPKLCIKPDIKPSTYCENQSIDEILHYPPRINDIYETDESMIVSYTYQFIVRYLIISKQTGKLINNGIILDRLSLKDRIFGCRSGVLFGIISADKFVEMRNNFGNKLQLNKKTPKLDLSKLDKNVNLEDNPIIVKYYLKEEL